MKFHADDSTALRRKRLLFMALAAAAVVLCLAFGLTWSLAVAAVFVMYILLNVIFAIFRI